MTLSELKRVAEAATPGEWVYDVYRKEVVSMHPDHRGFGITEPSRAEHEDPVENALHIATFSPARILRMIEVIERAAALRAAIHGDDDDGYSFDNTGAHVAFDKALEAL